jgi:Excalibur calcium-binding domain
MRHRAIAIAVFVAIVGTVGSVPANASPAASGRWKNCTTFNHVYPHGVGRDHAHDHTSGKPVTDFKHSTRLYKIAMSHNSDLDRDKDGIACEKA